MKVIETINKRHSYRGKYKSDTVPRGDLITIMKAGLNAPSGYNKQTTSLTTLGTMFVARGVAYIVNGNRNTDTIASGIGKEAADTFGNFSYYGSTFGIYNTFWIAIVLFAAFFFLLSGTRTVPARAPALTR